MTPHPDSPEPTAPEPEQPAQTPPQSGDLRTGSGAERPDTRPPLAGLLVADFSRVLAGPLATMMLADLGADVIKVERPGAGDDTRQWGPPWTEHASSYFESVNRSKSSVALDLKDPQDHATALAIAERADILVENFMTGKLDDLGLGYDELSARNPGLIYCSITGFGSGAGADLPGYDVVVQALGGLMSITGEADGDPMKSGVAVVDVLTGKDAVIAILAAVVERSRSGRGQHVEVNLLSSLLGSLVNQATAALTTGASPRRVGNRHPSIAPYQALHCRDGLLVVACGNDHQFRHLAATLGVPDLADDTRFATNPSRVANRVALTQALEAELRAGTVAHWVEALTHAGVPAGPVNDIAGAIERARELGLEPTVDVGPEHPAQIRHPITWSRSRVRPASPPPRLGEHTDLIRDREGRRP
jgi:crotonobetainyl-CoA:carnitine CoA-transferase CaiB-like acyl-CoA transferase